MDTETNPSHALTTKTHAGIARSFNHTTRAEGLHSTPSALRIRVRKHWHKEGRPTLQNLKPGSFSARGEDRSASLMNRGASLSLPARFSSKMSLYRAW